MSAWPRGPANPSHLVQASQRELQDGELLPEHLQRLRERLALPVASDGDAARGWHNWRGAKGPGARTLKSCAPRPLSCTQCAMSSRIVISPTLRGVTDAACARR